MRYPSAVHAAGIVIFALTYVLIAARRLTWLGLDRAAAALLGAVLCVVLGVVTPQRALTAIDGSTIVLLFGVMGVGAFVAADGLFDAAEHRLVRLASTPPRLLGAIVWSAGLASAVLTNDAVCVLGAPLVVRLIRKHELPPLPFLLALATAANTGSVATLVGNPQNMLCAGLGSLSYRSHLLLLGPVAVIGLVINHALLWLMFRSKLAAKQLEPGPVPRPEPGAAITLFVVGATIVAYFLEAHLAWTAMAAFATLMLLRRRDTRRLWSQIDWALLLFFAGLFVVVEGFLASGAPSVFFSHFPLVATSDGTVGWLRLSGIFLLGSNVVSNVPFILVVRDQMASLPNAALAWELLAMASTFAGNLTLLGSVANIIVAESARDIGGIGFWAYLKVGLPLTLTTTLIGTAWLLTFG